MTGKLSAREAAVTLDLTRGGSGLNPRSTALLKGLASGAFSALPPPARGAGSTPVSLAFGVADSSSPETPVPEIAAGGEDACARSEVRSYAGCEARWCLTRTHPRG